MAISPNDFSLWARLTGNKYPSTPAERAKKGPEVHNFIQNLGKEGMLGGKEAEEPKKERNLGEKIATGALIAGGVAAAVAAGRDPRVQNVARRAGSTAKDKVGDFLRNIGGPRVIDRDVVDASYDVTPNPREQQSNVAPQLRSYSESKLTGQSSRIPTRQQGPMPPEISLESVSADASENPFSQDQEELVREHAQLKGLGYGREFGTYEDRDPVSGYRYEDIKNKLQDIAATRKVEQPVAVDRFTPAVEGKTFGTSGAVSKLEDIGDAKLRARRTYGPMIDAVQQRNPGINVGGMGRSMLAKAEQDRDYDIAYMVARGQGKTDETATQIARQTAGFPTDSPVGKPTPYREFLGEQRTSSIRKESIDNLLNLVETGPQIILPEKAQKMNDGSSAIVLAGGGNNTNVIPTMGATIGGSSLTDKHATKMAVDNVLDNARHEFNQKVEQLVNTTGMGPRRAERQIYGSDEMIRVKNPETGRLEKVQKTGTEAGRKLIDAIKKDLTKTTGLNPEDASNIAESVINPTTGERQFNTDKFGDLGTETKRDIKDLKSVPNIDPATNQGTMKTAVGTAIRGRAPSYYEALPKTDTRELPGPFEETVPDRRTATRGGFGAALQKSIEEEGVSPAKMPEGGSAGIGIYGEGTGYLAGPFSKTASKAPTDTFGKSSPFKGVSDATLTKLKSDMKPGTKSFESVDKEQRGRASMDAARELRKIQTSGDPSTSTERVAKFLDNLKKQQGG